jgi:hypothetical protein
VMGMLLAIIAAIRRVGRGERRTEG